MPLFKRRNAVKIKEGKNASKKPSITGDETNVISEVNSMLTELVTAVSEKTDSASKNGANTFSENDIPNQANSTQASEEHSDSNSPNCSSEQKLSSLETGKCSNLTSRNNVSGQNDFALESEIIETLSEAHIYSTQIDSVQKNDECTETVQTNCSQENDTVMSQTSEKNTLKLTDSTQKNTDSTNSPQINQSSPNLLKNDESKNHVTTDDFVNQTNLVQTIDEDTNKFLTNDTSNEFNHVKNNDECGDSYSTDNISNLNSIKGEVCDSNITMNDSSVENVSSQGKMHSIKTTRSSSESGSVIESHAKYVRRKFGSEAEIMKICEQILPPDQQKGINETVANYIDNLIKESIFKAVKSINIDNLCEEVARDVSNRTNSQSTESEEDFVVEQRLSSNSISEFVELQNDESKTYDDQKDSMISECDRKLSETESLGNEADDTDRASFGGYLADLEDTTSVEDLKSAEEDSLCSSSCSGLENKFKLRGCNSESSSNAESIEKLPDKDNQENVTINEQEKFQHENKTCKQELTSERIVESEKSHPSEEKSDHVSQPNPEKNLAVDQHENHLSNENSRKNKNEIGENPLTLTKIHKEDLKIISPENSEISLKSLDEEDLLMKNDSQAKELENESQAKRGSITSQNAAEEEHKKVNWKVGNLHVKLPHKSRGKTSLKAWKKRRVVIQPDEFVNDPNNQSLVISIYGSKKHETTFWHSVSSQKAVVFRSSSHTHRYAFTISEEGQAIIHLSAENESETQEWMAAIRAVLWPPSPFMELEKMLSGQEFEVSIIDNEFSYHAGLLGMYGYLSITPKKLILLHPQQGYVIQEWYLNTVDKFQFVLQQKQDDMHKVLCMTTCKDSSTGQGDIILFCKEAVTLLQSLASNIHQVLSYHSKQEGGKYQKELEELAEWMVAPPQDCLNVENDEHYKVPPRQVKSLLDIPNFIFDKPLSPVASAIYPAPNTEVMETLDNTKNKLTNTSQDSGISTCTSSDDFLNCSSVSFVVGGGPMTGKSSDSELSDAYTPPRTPEIMKKRMLPEVVKEESSTLEE